MPPAFSPTQPPAGALPSALQTSHAPLAQPVTVPVAALRPVNPPTQPLPYSAAVSSLAAAAVGGGRRRRQRVAAAGKIEFLPRQGFGHRVCARLAFLQPGGELRQFCEGRRTAAALDAPCVETAQAADGPGVRLHRAGLFTADHTFPHKALRRVAADQTAHAPGSLAAFGAARQLQGQVGYPAALHGPRIAPHRAAGGVAGGRKRPRRPAPLKLSHPCRRLCRY